MVSSCQSTFRDIFWIMKIIAIASYNLKKFDGVGNSCYSQYRYFENKFGSRYKVLMASESTDYPFVINYQTLARLIFQIKLP